MNKILEEIVLVKVVQRRNYQNIILDHDVRELKKETVEQLRKAMQENNIKEWRIYRYMGNKPDKVGKMAKQGEPRE